MHMLCEEYLFASVSTICRQDFGSVPTVQYHFIQHLYNLLVVVSNISA